MNPSDSQYSPGMEKLRQGQFTEAIFCFQSCLAESTSIGQLPLYLLPLGECFLRLERYDEAIIPLAAATALDDEARAPALLSEVFLRIWELRDYPDLSMDILERALKMAALALEYAPNNRIARRVYERCLREGLSEPGTV